MVDPDNADLDEVTPSLVGAAANISTSVHELVECVNTREEWNTRRLERLHRRILRAIILGVIVAMISTYLAATLGVRAIVYCSNGTHDVTQERAHACNVLLWPSGVHYPPGPARMPDRANYKAP